MVCTCVPPAPAYEEPSLDSASDYTALASSPSPEPMPPCLPGVSLPPFLPANGRACAVAAVSWLAAARFHSQAAAAALLSPSLAGLASALAAELCAAVAAAAALDAAVVPAYAECLAARQRAAEAVEEAAVEFLATLHPTPPPTDDALLLFPTTPATRPARLGLFNGLSGAPF
jgi:hypothetical protein